MIIETFPVGWLQCNCTILGDEQNREAIVVDPGDDPDEILARLAKHKLTLKQSAAFCPLAIVAQYTPIETHAPTSAR